MTVLSRVGASLHNAQHSALESRVTQQKRPTATGLQHDGASRITALPLRIAKKISIERETGCWLWLGHVDKAGYGQVRHEGRTTCAHLAVYRELLGDHSAEDLDHRCRNRSCVNPAHLEPVSHRENMRRGGGFAGLNARKTHCKRGHEFTPENTEPHGKGNRNCRQCAKDRRSRSLPLLSHPALTPPPPELLSGTRTPIAGARRVSVAKSPYAVRAEEQGQLVGLVEFLLAVRRGVRRGETLLDVVSDGTLWGWRARLALSDVLSEPLANWDVRKGRTQLERLAVVERALAECGHQNGEHRGGWSISSGAK